MVLQAHLKKHIIALGGWLLMYTSGPPPPVWQMTTLFPFFFCYLPLFNIQQINSDWIQLRAFSPNKNIASMVQNFLKSL